MPRPTIENGEEYFFPILYEGNGGGQRVGKFVPFTDSGTIANSCLFETANNDNLSKTYSGAGTSQQTATISAWVKRCKTGNDFQTIFAVGSDKFKLAFNSGTYADAIQMYYYTGSYVIRAITKRTFEDTSKWYHIVFILDLSNSTQGDRWRLYVDGDRITAFESGFEIYPSNTTTTTNVGAADTYYVGKDHSTASYDGYIAEFNYIDGTAYEPSNFGLTDTSTGRWIPKTLTGLSYGTNGVRLQFGTGSAMGDDTSDNNNDYSPTGIDATNQYTDSPTQNHATLSPYSAYKYSNFTLSQGNLKSASSSVSGRGSAQGVMKIPNGGKYYWECEIDSGKDGMGLGIIPINNPSTSVNNSKATLYLSSGAVRTDGSNSLSYGSGVSNGDIMGFALDLSNPSHGKLYVSVNGVYENSGNPVTGANPAPANPLIGDFRVIYQDGSNGYAPVYIFNFGQKTFNTAPPTGYSALQQDNFPTTDKGVTALAWFKNRDATKSPTWYDSSRGKHLALFTSGTDANTTYTDSLQKFLKGGSQIEDNAHENQSGISFINWNWVANSGTTGTDHTQGSIDSTVQVNTTAGFSIVQWTGDNAAEATVGHGLSSTPEFIIIKNLNDVTDWWIYHKSLATLATADTNLKFSTAAPSNFAFGKYDHSGINETVMTLKQGSTNANAINGASDSMIAYCWHGVEGFSKFGSYAGNGVVDGPFIYTGFTPRFLMIKRISTTGSWFIYDTIREPLNPVFRWILADSGNAENSSNTTRYVDILSNGFKLRATGGDVNSGTLAYIAFAEHPFIGSKTLKGFSPVTAR